ncbi:MAG: hypothetical protein GX424_05135 [Clostridiales bacterium]|nr:hypothetical protein [Clostridiales bacterium]
MTLKIFSNRAAKEWKETFLWVLKKNRGIMALFALLLMIALPVGLMVAFSSAGVNLYITEPVNETFSRYFLTLSIYIVNPLLLLFVLVLSALLFSYLHNKRSVDLFHSLPAGRVPMLLGRWSAALTILFLPLLLSCLTAFAVGASYGVDARYCLAAPMVQLLQSMLMAAAALTFSIFIAVCTGTTFDMILSILAINISYPLLILTGTEFAKLLLPGLGWNVQPDSVLFTALAPFAAACLPFPNLLFAAGNSSAYFGSIKGNFLTWWLGMTLVLLFSSLFFYMRRKSECAESGFAFALPKIVIRFLVTAVAGIGAGLIFSLSGSNGGMFFPGLLLGSLAAHVTVEAVYSRGFGQMKKSFVFYGGFAALFVLFYGVLATGCFGYDTYVPSAQDVESITVSSVSSPVRALQYYYGSDTIGDTRGTQIAEITPTIRETENVKAVLNAIQAHVDEVRKTQYPYGLDSSTGNETIDLEYHLKNGAVVTRSYHAAVNTADNTSEISKMIDKIVQLPEYIQTSTLIFYIEPQMIGSVDLESKSSGNSNTFAPDQAQKEELLRAVQKDVLNRKPGTEDSTVNSSALVIQIKDKLVPTGKLKELTGNYSGEVTLYPIQVELNENTPNINAVLERFGWRQ